MQKTNAVTLGLHLLEIEITTRCNLNCGHCYNRSGEIIDMPVESINNLIGFAEKYNVKRVVISGGEAVLHPQFKDVINSIRKNKAKTKIVIQSNGLIGEIGIEDIKVFDIIHLSFEPDSSSIRSSSVEKILEMARKFIDAGVYTYLFATVHPGNVDKLDWMVEVANSHKIEIGFNLCIPGHKNELQLSGKEKNEIIEKLHKLHLSGRILRFTSPFAAILKNQKTEKYAGIKGGCTAGVAACVILPNGDVAPCPFFRIKVGNIYDNKLETIWLKSEIFSILRKRPMFEEPCGKCEYLSYCGGCRARAYYKTGKFNGFDADCIIKK
jgi:radical SAM protein with 4Fe4S-binding SPASM domain